MLLPINYINNLKIITDFFNAYNIDNCVNKSSDYLTSEFLFVIEDYTFICTVNMIPIIYKNEIEIIALNFEIRLSKLPKFNHKKIMSYLYDNFIYRFILKHNETLFDLCSNINNILKNEILKYFFIENSKKEHFFQNIYNILIDIDNNLNGCEDIDIINHMNIISIKMLNDLVYYN